MDQHEIKEILKKKPADSELAIGQLKVTRDGIEVVYPASYFNRQEGVLLVAFVIYNSSGWPVEGIYFRILADNIGKENVLPDGSSYVTFSLDDKSYVAKEGTLKINYDAPFSLVHGNFDVTMGVESPFSKFEKGIFSIRY